MLVVTSDLSILMIGEYGNGEKTFEAKLRRQEAWGYRHTSVELKDIFVVAKIIISYRLVIIVVVIE